MQISAVIASKVMQRRDVHGPEHDQALCVFGPWTCFFQRRVGRTKTLNCCQMAAPRRLVPNQTKELLLACCNGLEGCCANQSLIVVTMASRVIKLSALQCISYAVTHETLQTHMAVASGKAPGSAQWLGTGPDREFPYRSSSSRLGHFVLSPQAAGRGPPRLFCCRCSCCRSCITRTQHSDCLANCASAADFETDKTKLSCHLLEVHLLQKLEPALTR